jgi:hypothetical protein
MGMAVGPGGAAVGGPAGVGNAGVAVKHLLEVDVGGIDHLAELDHLADLLEGDNLVGLVAIDAETGRVVAAVFEAAQAWGDGISKAEGSMQRGRTIDESIEDVLAVLFDQVVDVAKNSTGKSWLGGADGNGAGNAPHGRCRASSVRGR